MVLEGMISVRGMNRTFFGKSCEDDVKNYRYQHFIKLLVCSIAFEHEFLKIFMFCKKLYNRFCKHCRKHSINNFIVNIIEDFHVMT